MSKLLVKEKEIVVPGEVIAEGMDYLPGYGNYRDKEMIIASQLGMVSISGRVIKIIPLRAKYSPKVGDTVIGRVVDMTFSNWFVDIDCANWAAMSIKNVPEYVESGADLSQYYTFGDWVSAKIGKVTRHNIDLTMKSIGLRKLGPGRIIKVTPTKVPRIIGKQGSMVTLIKDATGCRITVGQNGIVWIQGEADKEIKAVEAIQFIDANAHKEGLTDKVGKFLGVKNEEKK